METLSLVIIEDEKIMLEELVSTIDWASIGLVVVATAEDGVMGEKIIKEYKWEIIFDANVNVFETEYIENRQGHRKMPL